MMLEPTATGPSIVICATCRVSSDLREDGSGRRGGALLAEAMLEIQRRDSRYEGLGIQTMSCFFACSEHISVHLRAPGKISYVLGRFTPDAEAATAILDYALLYADSAHGSVRYAQWPEGVKGHFISRSPPEGFVLR